MLQRRITCCAEIKDIRDIGVTNRVVNWHIIGNNIHFKGRRCAGVLSRPGHSHNGSTPIEYSVEPNIGASICKRNSMLQNKITNGISVLNDASHQSRFIRIGRPIAPIK